MREFPADPGHFSACPRNASLRSSSAPTAPREKIPLFQVGLDPDSIPVHPSPPDHGAAPCQSPSCCPAGNLPCFSWNSRAAGGCEGWDAELLECLAFPQPSGNFRICCAIDGWQGRLESDETMDMQGREMWIPGSTEPGSVCLNSATGADSRLNIGKNPSPRGCWALNSSPGNGHVPKPARAPGEFGQRSQGCPGWGDFGIVPWPGVGSMILVDPCKNIPWFHHSCTYSTWIPPKFSRGSPKTSKVKLWKPLRICHSKEGQTQLQGHSWI